MYKCIFLLLIVICVKGFSQTGSVNEPVRYVGGETTDPSVHDGRLRWAVGVENIQTLRANRTHPELVDNYGWTYNHAPFIAWWNGLFYLRYLSNPAFPPYKAPEGVKIPEGYKGYMMHQRMGFYTAPS